MKKLLELLMRLAKERWYGDVIIKLQAGKVRHIEKHESLDITQFEEKE